jgi:hypothetical protein
MRIFVISIWLLFFTTLANAQSNSSSSLNLAIPAPAQSYQSDRIRAGELDCSNAIGGGTNLEFGVTGIINRQDDPLVMNYGDRTADVGVYARITIPLDKPKERINCNTLYQLELVRKRIEIEKLQQELNNLKKLQFDK